MVTGGKQPQGGQLERLSGKTSFRGSDSLSFSVKEKRGIRRVPPARNGQYPMIGGKVTE